MELVKLKSITKSSDVFFPSHLINNKRNIADDGRIKIVEKSQKSLGFCRSRLINTKYISLSVELPWLPRSARHQIAVVKNV